MSEKPKRRWFQWRLSTWLVLVGIVAWAMACKPVIQLSPPGFMFPKAPDDGWMLLCGIEQAPSKAGFLLAINVGPTVLKWPALALLAFVTWKLAWRVVERRRKSAAQTVE